jgi:hypothetical protein
MQNVAWMYPAAAPIGYVIYPPTYGYFPAKNDLATAAALSAKGVPPYAAATAEFAIYKAHAATLRAFGATVPLPVDRSLPGIRKPNSFDVADGASCILHRICRGADCQLANRLVEMMPKGRHPDSGDKYAPHSDRLKKLRERKVGPPEVRHSRAVLDKILDGTRYFVYAPWLKLMHLIQSKFELRKKHSFQYHVH